jgi:hypothetical protein
LKRCLSVTVGAVFLLALAVFMVLTSTATILITLGVLTAVVYGLFRLVLTGTQDVHNPRPGR